MTIDELCKEIEAICLRFPFIRQVVKLDETKYSVKYRLVLEKDLYIQIYRNLRNGTIGQVLVHQGRRLYGRDYDKGRWHKHPYENPDNHDFSAEGLREVLHEEFIAEVSAILTRERLI